MKKIKDIITVFFLLTIFTTCQHQVQHKTEGVYMGMKYTTAPLLLSPELISSSLDEYNGTFSPDGKEFFFTTNTPQNGIICYTFMDDNGIWTEAKVAAFSGEYSEYDPLFSPSGNRLYFSSERPLDNVDSLRKTNIWYTEKQHATWSEPKYLELEKQGTYYSSITNKEDIYFNIWDTGDMYKAIRSENGYKIEALAEVLNSNNGEGDPFISPEEDYLIFRGYNESLGQGDLYISYKIEGNWTAPENLGKPINSEAHEMCPYVTVDGKFFIFSSNRINQQYESIANKKLDKVRQKHQTNDNGELNIYYISADFIKEKRKKHE